MQLLLGCSSDTVITVGGPYILLPLLTQHCAAASELQQAKQPSKWVYPYVQLPSLIQECAAHLSVKTADIETGDSAEKSYLWHVMALRNNP